VARVRRWACLEDDRVDLALDAGAGRLLAEGRAAVLREQPLEGVHRLAKASRGAVDLGDAQARAGPGRDLALLRVERRARIASLARERLQVLDPGRGVVEVL